MAVTTALSRAVGTAVSTAGTSKSIAIPSGYAAGDLMILYYVSGAGQPDADPTGWIRWSQTNDGSGYWSMWVKKATSADISAGTVTLTVSAAGKASMAICGFYATSADCAILAGTRKVATVSESSHAVTAFTVPGPATIVSFLGLKDLATASGNYAAPAGLGTATVAASGGTNQTVAAVAVNTGGDVGAGTWGAGATWDVTAADGTTAVVSNHAAVFAHAVCGVLRPSADVTVPAGATFTGGTTVTQVTGDDDGNTYVEFGGTSATLEVKVGVNGTVPSFVQVDLVGVNAPTSTSVHAYAVLGTTILQDLGTDSTLIGSAGYSMVVSLAALTSTQRSNILADPTNFRIRLVCSVS